MKYAPSEINNIAKFHNQMDLLNKLCQYSIYQIGLIWYIMFQYVQYNR